MPLYWSYFESKTNARVKFVSPDGEGITFIIFDTRSDIPSPVFAEHWRISSFRNPNVLINSLITVSVWAEGKSILLITGIIFKPKSKAR